MLPVRMERMLTFFDVFGYKSGSSQLSHRRQIANSIYCVHFLIAIFFSISIFYLTYEGPFTTFIENVNNRFQYLTALFTYWFIIFDSIIRSQNHRQFWTILQKIDQLFYSQNNLRFRVYLIKFIQYMLTTFLAVFMAITSSEPSSLRWILISVFLVKQCQIRIFYYIFCVEVLYLQLCAIENELQKMNQLSKLTDSNVHSFRFQWIRGYYNCICKMTCLLYEIFDWSHVAAVSFCFFLLLTEMNWLLTNYRGLGFLKSVG